MEGEPVKSICIEDVTNMTDVLLQRSGKFKAFFSRAELEAHIVAGLYETRAAIPTGEFTTRRVKGE